MTCWRYSATAGQVAVPVRHRSSLITTLRPARQLRDGLHLVEKLGSCDGAASHRVNSPPPATWANRMLPPMLHPRRSVNVAAAIRSKTPASAVTSPLLPTS